MQRKRPETKRKYPYEVLVGFNIQDVKPVKEIVFAKSPRDALNVYLEDTKRYADNLNIPKHYERVQIVAVENGGIIYAMKRVGDTFRFGTLNSMKKMVC